MATNFPKNPALTAADLEQVISQLKYQKSVHPPTPQARIELAKDGSETLELGDFEITAHAPVVTFGVNGTVIEANLTISSVVTKKVALTITKDKIIIGNPLKEHIVLEL